MYRHKNKDKEHPKRENINIEKQEIANSTLWTSDMPCQYPSSRRRNCTSRNNWSVTRNWQSWQAENRRRSEIQLRECSRAGSLLGAPKKGDGWSVFAQARVLASTRPSSEQRSRWQQHRALSCLLDSKVRWALSPMLRNGRVGKASNRCWMALSWTAAPPKASKCSRTCGALARVQRIAFSTWTWVTLPDVHFATSCKDICWRRAMIRSPYHDLATVPDKSICPENIEFPKFQRVGRSQALTRVQRVEESTGGDAPGTSHSWRERSAPARSIRASSLRVTRRD